jgi:uncharacterized protein YlzI (FlbEa/FlbD family)
MKVNSIDNKEVRVNIDQIVDYFEYQGGTRIRYANGKWITTTNAIEEVDKKIIACNKRDADNMNLFTEKLTNVIRDSK